MEKRLLIALGLAALVILLSQRLFPGPPPLTKTSADSSLAHGVSKDSLHGSQAQESTVVSTLKQSDTTIGGNLLGDTVSLITPKAIYHFGSIGAAPLDVVLTDYHRLPQGLNQKVVLGRPRSPLLSYAIVNGRDTLYLDHVKFGIDSSRVGAHTGIAFKADVQNLHVDISYSFTSNGYLGSVKGSVTGAGPSAIFLIRMHRGLPFVEADSVDDLRSLAYVAKPVRDDAESIPFAKLDSLQPRLDQDSIAWVASKNKYFLLALIPTPPARPFSAAVFTRGLHEPKAVSSADALILQPITSGGAFGFDIYAGPQEWRRLHQMGRNLEHVNPYGGFLRFVVQPFATIVMQVVLWIHDRLKINYGWVLIIFGITIRLLLWPLNQGAMRNSLKLQRIQPQLQEIQKKYKSNPEKLQAEMSKLYRDHGMSPFTPLAGCLPMLIPMPVLFALYFVFQNTIEFRGVSFLWLPDLSQRDPYFILPAVMGISMYLLSWISMRSAPPTP